MSLSALCGAPLATGHIVIGGFDVTDGYSDGFLTSNAFGSLSPSNLQIRGLLIRDIYVLNISPFNFVVGTSDHQTLYPSADQSLFNAICLGDAIYRTADAVDFYTAGAFNRVTYWEFTQLAEHPDWTGGNTIPFIVT